MNVAPIKPPIAPELAVTRERAPDKVDLAESFASALKNAHAAENTATSAAEQFARGDTGMGIHEVMIATEKANLAVRFTTTFKNKALEAYRELINTQV